MGAIKFGELWNCCPGNEAAVITFDEGSEHAVCRRCANQYTGPVRDITPEELAPENRADPRYVGDLCYSGYWNEHYVVLAISDSGEFTVLWLGVNQSINPESSSVTTHCTPWDWARDKRTGFNVIQYMSEGPYASYDEFIEVMRDCAQYWL